MHAAFTRHGFLPHPDPLQKLPAEFEALDTLGRDLPSLLEDKDARLYLKNFTAPPWPGDLVTDADRPALRLYYVRLGFVASGYVNQVSQPPATLLPKNIAVPLCHSDFGWADMDIHQRVADPRGNGGTPYRLWWQQ